MIYLWSEGLSKTRPLLVSIHYFFLEKMIGISLFVLKQFCNSFNRFSREQFFVCQDWPVCSNSLFHNEGLFLFWNVKNFVSFCAQELRLLRFSLVISLNFIFTFVLLYFSLSTFLNVFSSCTYPYYIWVLWWSLMFMTFVGRFGPEVSATDKSNQDISATSWF